jgi:hypothetical protein
VNDDEFDLLMGYYYCNDEYQFGCEDDGVVETMMQKDSNHRIVVVVD